MESAAKRKSAADQVGDQTASAASDRDEAAVVPSVIRVDHRGDQSRLHRDSVPKMSWSCLGTRTPSDGWKGGARNHPDRTTRPKASLATVYSAPPEASTKVLLRAGFPAPMLVVDVNDVVCRTLQDGESSWERPWEKTALRTKPLPLGANGDADESLAERSTPALMRARVTEALRVSSFRGDRENRPRHAPTSEDMLRLAAPKYKDIG